MGAIISAIATWMGWAIRFFYDLTLNYGIAIILFTILIKLLLVPLNIKQQKSMKESQEIQPLIKEIQEKYKNNQQKQSEEMTKLYKERKINPFGGCLLLLLQIPIIFAMFYAIQQPITYMFPEVKTTEVEEQINAYEGNNKTYKEVYYIAEHKKDLLNTSFLGLDLAQVPNNNMKNWTVWIIPILSFITTYMTSKLTMKQSDTPGNEQAMKMQKNMLFVMPIMTTYISFIVPLGMGLYWLINNIVSVIIQTLITKYQNRDKIKLIA